MPQPSNDTDRALRVYAAMKGALAAFRAGKPQSEWPKMPYPHLDAQPVRPESAASNSVAPSVAAKNTGPK
jgi:hypothetical protein